jgi:hypothetical protein
VALQNIVAFVKGTKVNGNQGYYNKAVAAHPVSALPGYLMGGLSWFAIPWLRATMMGPCALALEKSPAFPTYANKMAEADVSTAATSASSAELIAV